MVLSSRYLRLLEPYMEGPDVTHLQERLQELGYYEGEIDGVYQEQIFEAVRQYQADYGLNPDGVVGPDTWNSIGLSPQRQYPLPQGGESIEVDLNQKKLVFMRFNEIINTYPVAVGKPSTPTPVGEWRVVQKIMNPGGPFGTRWMRLNIPWGGYGIHGTNNPDSIGTAASNGCIRMYNEDVNQLYDMVPLGTPVKITGEVFSGRILTLGVEPGPDIFAVKANLSTLGYYSGEIDGVFDEALQNAVMAFQQDFNLVADGVVGVDVYNQIQLAVDQYTDNREP